MSATSPSVPDVLGGLAEPTPLRRRLRTLTTIARRKPLGAVSAIVVVALIVLALLAPVIADGYTATNVRARLEDPSLAHWLGTDHLGRDVWARIVWGARVSLAVALGATLLSVGISTLLGIVSGYLGGWVDTILQRAVDIWMSFPSLLLVLAILGIVRPGLWGLVFAIGLVLGGLSSRIIRSGTLAVRSTQYVEAARATGVSDLRIMVRHVFPNIVPILTVTATAQIGFIILLEAAVSFLGYGVPPPTPSWGGMLGGEGRDYIVEQPLLSLWPGLAIFIAVYAFNMLGDTVRDVLDPRLRA